MRRLNASLSHTFQFRRCCVDCMEKTGLMVRDNSGNNAKKPCQKSDDYLSCVDRSLRFATLRWKWEHETGR